MYAVPLAPDADEAAFRETARRCVALGVAPHDIVFAGDASSLFAPLPEAAAPLALRVPRAYGELMRDAVCHRAPDRFALLYDVLWRIARGERELADNPADASVAQLAGYARNVRRDIHKMHAFVRFRVREVDGKALYVAWFEPKHFILRRAAPFFVDRFASMDWLIATPLGTAAWAAGELTFGPPGPRPAHAGDAVLDDLWLTYYRTTFNPARLRLKAMAAEMPRRYWPNMPEASAIRELAANAARRVDDMQTRAPDAPPRFAHALAARPHAAASAPDGPMPPLHGELDACRRCPLHACATQAVAGEGPAEARVMLVGEQPGDHEDLAGRPFVGPAGQLLDRALAEAGLDRAALYLTNAVKHFKFEPRGRRRIHQKPSAGEVAACRWWLERELAALRPRLVVALGATAAGALAQRQISVTRERGPAAFGAQSGFVTVHPSFLLRLPDARRREEEYAAFVADLRQVRELAAA